MAGHGCGSDFTRMAMVTACTIHDPSDMDSQLFMIVKGRIDVIRFCNRYSSISLDSFTRVWFFISSGL